MKKIKIIGIVIVALAVIIQFIPAQLPETSTNNPNDLLANNEIPDSIASLFINGCYDCHSNQTVYPWYSNIQPTAWLVVRDTKLGREQLNFSDWESFPIKKKLKILNETAAVIEEKEMPFPPYMLIHKKARFSAEERKRMIKWTERFGEELFN
ncbi:MAG: heme-binding domain-containing protein [Prolixibacteraceae bacterium]